MAMVRPSPASPTASTGIFAPRLVVRVGWDHNATPPGRTSPSTFAPGMSGSSSPTTSRSSDRSGAARPSSVQSGTKGEVSALVAPGAPSSSTGSTEASGVPA